MRNDDVLQHPQRFDRQFLAGLLGRHRRLELQPDRPAHDVANEISIRGVFEPALPAQLRGLAQIVQKKTHDHDVAIELRIQRQHRLREFQQLQGVFEQPADPGMVQIHRRRRGAELAHHFLIGEIGVGHGAHARVRHRLHNPRHLGEHLRDVLGGGGQQRRDFFLGNFHRLDLLEDQLHLAVVQLRVAGNPDETGLLQFGEVGVVEGPLPCRDFAGGVAQKTFEERLAPAGGADLRVLQAVDAIHIPLRRQAAQIGVRAFRGGIHGLFREDGGRFRCVG